MRIWTAANPALLLVNLHQPVWGEFSPIRSVGRQPPASADFFKSCVVEKDIKVDRGCRLLLTDPEYQEPRLRTGSERHKRSSWARKWIENR